MDKKTELMRQAIRLFAEKGYHQTTILEIAQAAGISKGAFYHHFESKESMLIAILKHNYEEMIKRANAPIEKQGLSKKDIFMKKEG